jgi:quinoprotein glucose dehydrogenase
MKFLFCNIKNYVFIACLLFMACNEKQAYNTWEIYKGSNENIHYSSLTQIDTANVTQLQMAWEYHTGDADTANYSQIQCNPIIIKGILYGTSPAMKLFAIDAATGKQKWLFDPFDSLSGDKKQFYNLNNCRGVTYWSDGKDDERIFYTAGSNLFAINARSGKQVTSFGDTGKIDLHKGLDRDVSDLFVTATSPPILYRNLLITGSRVDEGAAAAPGHIRAYDVRTGKRRWIFHTIPHPVEYGYNTWDDPEAYKFIGGANAWSGFSLDNKRGILFACTGSASYDWYGGRRTGKNLFANCVLALDASTGKRIWHFQGIHHDVWDRDFSSPPALVTIKKDGKTIDAIAVSSKSGFIYLFERATGKPVYDIVERIVPATSDLKGEKLSPTQPYPTFPPPFVRQLFTEKDINPLLPDTSYQNIKKRLASYKHDHMFNPPSLQGTVEFPGLDGGGEWGGPSYDPATGILYVNANEMAWVIQAVNIKQEIKENETYAEAGKRLYQGNCMQCHGVNREGSGNFPSLVSVSKKYTPAAFDTLVQTGRRMMPAFKQLKQEERKAIASFILDLANEKHKKFKVTDSLTNDPTKLPYTIAGYNKFVTGDGLPAISPPWGTLNALDLNTGKYVWKTTLGNDAAFPNAKEPTGVENYGASVVTAGGLVFIGAAKDGKFRAFNKRTGKLLWETTLPAPAYATPAVYEVEGKQYVVIACGGGKMRTRSGDSYVAFALPD